MAKRLPPSLPTSSPTIYNNQSEQYAQPQQQAMGPATSLTMAEGLNLTDHTKDPRIYYAALKAQILSPFRHPHSLTST
jgi:putative NADH-flavin reductase